MAPLGIHNTDPDASSRPYRTELARRRRKRVGGHLMGGFGHAVGFEHRRAEKAFHLLRNFHGQRSAARADERSEEHTSELQSRLHLVCRLLLEKKKKRE